MSVSSAVAGPAARRYARAWFEAARDAEALDAVRADARLLEAVFSDAEALAAVADPRIEDDRKRGLVERAFGELLHPVTRSLVGVLARRKRLTLLPALPSALATLDDARAGRVRGRLESARELPEDAVAQVARVLSERTGKEVRLSAEVREDLLGGIRVTLGGVRFDGSVRGRLDALRRRLDSADIA